MEKQYYFDWRKFRNDFRAWEYTQFEKADALKVSRSKISRLESGKGSCTLSVEELAKACSLMGKDPAAYYELDPLWKQGK